jgi:hypothetical protein
VDGGQHNGPDEAWEAIAASPLFSVYVHELHWLASSVVRRAESVFDQVPSPPSGSDYIHVDPDLHSEIYALLGEAAKIRALITGRPKRKDQSAREHEVLSRRARTLRCLLSDLSVEAICSPAARHSLEHFDEVIDRTAIGALEDTIPRPVNMPLDLVVWSRAAFEVLKGTLTPRPAIFPLRVYVASERHFLNAEREINIGDLYRECAAVRDRLKAHLPIVDERGAFVVVLTDSSFSR